MFTLNGYKDKHYTNILALYSDCSNFRSILSTTSQSCDPALYSWGMAVKAGLNISINPAHTFSCFKSQLPAVSLQIFLSFLFWHFILAKKRENRNTVFFSFFSFFIPAISLIPLPLGYGCSTALLPLTHSHCVISSPRLPWLVCQRHQLKSTSSLSPLLFSIDTFLM